MARKSTDETAEVEQAPKPLPEVAFVPADETGRFQFHGDDGSEFVVTVAKPFSTSDVNTIAFLDGTPSVKRAPKGKA